MTNQNALHILTKAETLVMGMQQALFDEAPETAKEAPRQQEPEGAKKGYIEIDIKKSCGYCNLERVDVAGVDFEEGTRYCPITQRATNKYQSHRPEWCPAKPAKPPMTNYDACCKSPESMADIIDIAKVGWSRIQILEWLKQEVK